MTERRPKPAGIIREIFDNLPEREGLTIFGIIETALADHGRVVTSREVVEALKVMIDAGDVRSRREDRIRIAGPFLAMHKGTFVDTVDAAAGRAGCRPESYALANVLTMKVNGVDERDLVRAMTNSDNDDPAAEIRRLGELGILEYLTVARFYPSVDRSRQYAKRVLAVLRDCRAATVADLYEETGISATVINEALDALVARGLVRVSFRDKVSAHERSLMRRPATRSTLIYRITRAGMGRDGGES